VMHHVPPVQWPRFVTEARRVLRRGGQVVIFEHNPLNPVTRHVVANNDIDADAVLLRHTQLAEMLEDAGLQGVYTRSILFTPFDQRLFRRMDEALGWLPLGAQYYATATAP
jgi:SAM-dependent methyltransferase